MSNLKVLIVEDEALVATDIEESLESLGYIVQNAVATGKAAIEEVEKNLPDVILMDIMLKGDMTGIDAANIIRQKHNVPIIYLTANADISTIEKAKVSLPYGYIIKPFTERDLQTNIEIARFKFENDIKSKIESDQFNQFFGIGTEKKGHVIVQGEKGLEKINPDDVYFIEKQADHTVLHLFDQEIFSKSSFEEIGKLFPEEKFIIVSDLFIVNVNKIFLAKFPEIIIVDKMSVITVDNDRQDEIKRRIDR
jgi:CheY-like chemotaxis protein